MAETKIEWTEKTWNPITGCNKVSAGCKNCYAEGIAKRFWGERKFGDVEYHEDRLTQPLRWRKPSMVFVNSMSDLFHESIDFSVIAKIFDVMATDLIPRKGKTWEDCEDESDYKDVAKHTYQILTKRPERIEDFVYYLSENVGGDNPISVTMEVTGNFGDNIWLGVSVENAGTIGRIEPLVKSPSKIKFISFEPLLEPIDFYSEVSERQIDWTKLNWAIIGCESGHKKRECKIEWVRALVKDLKFLGIKIFIKQLNINGKVIKDINQFPEDLRIREYPHNRGIE